GLRLRSSHQVELRLCGVLSGFDLVAVGFANGVGTDEGLVLLTHLKLTLHHCSIRPRSDCQPCRTLMRKYLTTLEAGLHPSFLSRDFTCGNCVACVLLCDLLVHQSNLALITIHRSLSLAALISAIG